MTGEFVKKKLENAGYQLNTVAEIINVSPQNLHSKLKTKDIRVSFLVELAKAINKPIDYFFDDYKNDLAGYREKSNNDYIEIANKLIKQLEENARLKEILRKYEGAD